MNKPTQEKGHWRIRDDNGKLLASLTKSGNLTGDPRCYPALMGAVMPENFSLRIIRRWDEAPDSFIVPFTKYPFIKIFRIEVGGREKLSEAFTGLGMGTAGTIPYQKRRISKVLREKGQQAFIDAVRKGIKKSGLAPGFNKKTVMQYLRGWEKVLEESGGDKQDL